MAKNEGYREAVRKIEEARRTGATELDLHSEYTSPESKKLTELPPELSQLTLLKSLNLSGNLLTSLPDWLGGLEGLESLDLYSNQLNALPASLGSLRNLRVLSLSYCGLDAAPDLVFRLPGLRSLRLHGLKIPTLSSEIGQLRKLEYLCLVDNKLSQLPDEIGELHNLGMLECQQNQLTAIPDTVGKLHTLRRLDLGDNRLVDLPTSLTNLENLTHLYLDNNPLNPDLAAAYKEGLDAVKRYLRAKTEGEVALNEAKLILTGEGEVGKSCLLGALRGDPWEDNRLTTHGIEIKPVNVTDPETETEIRLNGWDFGGQRVYRPTHQFFFSAPAVYLVVWKPREGPQQGMVKEWISLVKHREPEAKILVVATHGGPNERQPDIDRQEIWDLFGRDTVVDFLHVESRPNAEGDCKGIRELGEAIARVATNLPEIGRPVPKRWHDARAALAKRPEPYLPLDQVFAICKEHQVEEDDARLLVRICRRVGDLIHYEHDPALHDVVVLKPNWLATAISFVLDDKQTRDGHGLVSFGRLGELWNDTARAEEFRYDPRLHPLFLRLMERFDLSYKVALPSDSTDAIGFWQRIGSVFRKADSRAVVPEIRYTSLIAQLVPDVRPSKEELSRVWPDTPGDGDEQRSQICRIVDAKGRQSATAEGLFYQLIVRLHRFSLGRVNYADSVHWQRGLVLDDEYNGRALLEHVGNDVRITVRAPYPEKLLSVLTSDVEWLVENFWEGLRCDVMVPCIEPCGKDAPGTGLFEVEKLIESKRRKRPEYPCPVCHEWQDIDTLLRNAPAARRDPLIELLSAFQSMKNEVQAIRPLLREQQGEVMRRFETNEARILSRVDDAFAGLMTALTDEAKEGPRLFSFEPVDRSKFNPRGWVSAKFRVTLWCEHSRVPLPLLNAKDPKLGVYEFDVPREWLVQAAPFLQVLSATLSVVLPVAASATKLAMNDDTYKLIEKQLELGKACTEAMLKTGENTADWLAETRGPELERERTLPGGGAIRAQGGALRQWQTWIKEIDPGFGGLVRVQNKRQEFLWVHPWFKENY